jgi:hypothetical protein
MMLTQSCSRNPAEISEATTRTSGPIGAKNRLVLLAGAV